MVRSAAELDSALDAVAGIAASGRRIALSLDYDGTLTPIVSRPELAILSAEMRAVVREAAATFALVAVLSGRDRREVEKLVAIPELAYVGSHGFDIQGPPRSGLRHEVGGDHVAALDQVESDLRLRLAHCTGVLIERKRFSVAVHFRLAPAADLPRIDEEVARSVAPHPGLRRAGGKAVHEVQPAVAWDKGRALLWLLDRLALRDALPIHVGDDLTDETVFAALAERGLGVYVGDARRDTAATLRLRDPADVQRLLGSLITAVRQRETEQQRQQQQ